MNLDILQEELEYSKNLLDKYSNDRDCNDKDCWVENKNSILVSYVDNKNKTYRYYEINRYRDKDGKLQKNRRLVKKSERERLISLVENSYREHIIKDLENNITTIETFLKKYNLLAPGSNYLYKNPGILKLLRESRNRRKALDENNSVPFETAISLKNNIRERQDCDYISEDAWKWAKDEYPTNPKYRDKKKFETLDGHMVDSKSEVIISDALYNKGIPYRYSSAFKTRGGMIIYPDFMFKNSAKDEYVIWEHFGRMFDLQYVHEAAEKFRWYGELGYYPGHGLIMTFESENSLDSATVARVIKENFGI